MAIESITCPNCGNTGIQIDTSREHSVCSYCSSTLKTKDVIHVDMESMTLAKLKSNAQRSFEVGQYKNARADWLDAIEIDRTDHESYWGIVRCDMATKPTKKFKQTSEYALALSYAPPELAADYMQQVEAHNAKAHELYEAREAKARARAAEARAAQALNADREAKAREASAKKQTAMRVLFVIGAVIFAVAMIFGVISLLTPVA